MSLLSWYGLKNEAEAITGTIAKVNGYSQQESELFVIRQIVARFLEELWSDFAEEFEEEFNDEDLAESMSRLNVDEDHQLYSKNKLQKASAWYYVTYGDTNSAILSFPWVVSKYLAAIKKNKIGYVKPVNPVMEKLNRDLMTIFVTKQLPECYTIVPKLIIPFQNSLVSMDQLYLAYRVLHKWALTQRLFEGGSYLSTQKSLDKLLIEFVNTRIDYQVENTMQLIIEFLSFCSYLPYVCDKPNLKLHERELLNEPIRQFGYRAMQVCIINYFIQ